MIFPTMLARSPRHKHWPVGPAHFSDRRTSSGQYILSVTGPYGPPRYMSGHQISNSAGPNDDNSQYVFFAPTSRQFSRSPFATARRQRVASPSRACQSNTLTSVFRSRGTSTRTSGTHPGTFLREAHVMVPSKGVAMDTEPYPVVAGLLIRKAVTR